MSVSKQEYILRSLAKIRHKKWEFFVVSRIIHSINEDVEFITQQLVKRPEGKRALTDLYFPQFNIHLEVDEPHHSNQVSDDQNRQQDIVRITEDVVVRIKISEGDDVLGMVKDEVDLFIELINEKRQGYIQSGSYIPWDFDKRYCANQYIEKGSISIKENVVFRTQVETLRCFGFSGKAWRRGAWVIPDGSHDFVWFPRLYPHGMWHNELSNDGMRIYEKADRSNPDAILSIKQQMDDESKYPNRKRIVFAKAKDPLGFNLLRYVGTFIVKFDECKHDNMVFERIATSEAVR